VFLDSRERSNFLSQYQTGPIKIFIICFMIVWVFIALSMGFLFLEMASNWPTNFPGPSPMLFVWIPFVMAGAGVLMLVGVLKGFSRFSPNQGDDDIQIVSDQFEEGQTRTFGYRPTSSPEIPEFCPNCETVFEYEQLQWTGPLSFLCPRCGNTQHVKRKKY